MLNQNIVKGFPYPSLERVFAYLRVLEKKLIFRHTKLECTDYFWRRYMATPATEIRQCQQMVFFLRISRHIRVYQYDKVARQRYTNRHQNIVVVLIQKLHVQRHNVNSRNLQSYLRQCIRNNICYDVHWSRYICLSLLLDTWKFENVNT